MSDEEMAAEIEPKPTRRGGRQPVERLWDDDGFRVRVCQIAEPQGLSLGDVMLGAGTSSDYLTEEHPYGRNVNIMMRIAKFLKVDPAFLIFGEGNSARGRQGAVKQRQTRLSATGNTLDMGQQMVVIEEMLRIAGATVKAAEAVAEAMRCVARSNQQQIEALVDERNEFFHFRPVPRRDEEA